MSMEMSKGSAPNTMAEALDAPFVRCDPFDRRCKFSD